MLKIRFDKVLTLVISLGLYISCSGVALAQKWSSLLKIEGVTFSQFLSSTPTLFVTHSDDLEINTSSLFANSSPTLMNMSYKVESSVLSELMVASPLLPDEIAPVAESTEIKTEIPEITEKVIGEEVKIEDMKEKKVLEDLIIETPIPVATARPDDKQKEKVLGLSNGGLDAEKLFEMSNSYRVSKGLTPFEKDPRACALAVSRAPEIYKEIYGGVMHSGLKARGLDYWNMENIIAMNSEEKAFNWWVNDYIHRVQIEADNKYSCVACSGNSCVQEFTNFLPK